MNIGIFHFQVGGTDGVSLEIDKWKLVLEEMGHQVFLCGGDLGTADGTLIPEMYHHRKDAKRLYRNSFVALEDYDAYAYKTELEALSHIIETKLREFIAANNIEFLIPHNIWSVAANPAVAPAMAKIVHDLSLPTLAHNHDFYWERIEGCALTCSTAIELADRYLPPRDELITHGVINSLAQKQLAVRKGIESTVIPNVFDFAAPAWVVDEYNRDFRKNVGLGDNDIVLLQATRIVRRKSIELAVDFVKALGDPERRARLEKSGLYDGRPFSSDDRIVLVLAGYAQDDVGGQYIEALKKKIDRSGIDALFIEDSVDAERLMRNDHKVYSLWDTYVFADFVTYPSIWEGWGNQLLEALRAKLPFMIFEYPVYTADLGDKGFRPVSLGRNIAGSDDLGLKQVSPDVIEEAADKAVELLIDNDLRQEWVQHNFDVANAYYSMTALRGYLEELVS